MEKGARADRGNDAMDYLHLCSPEEFEQQTCELSVVSRSPQLSI